jgi:hypothetical protein
MQKLCHSGTLRAMSERVPAHKTTNHAEPAVYESGGDDDVAAHKVALAKDTRPPETGGPAGPEPTRYGDWERKGRCIDF